MSRLLNFTYFIKVRSIIFFVEIMSSFARATLNTSKTVLGASSGIRTQAQAALYHKNVSFCHVFLGLYVLT